MVAMAKMVDASPISAGTSAGFAIAAGVPGANGGKAVMVAARKKDQLTGLTAQEEPMNPRAIQAPRARARYGTGTVATRRARKTTVVRGTGTGKRECTVKAAHMFRVKVVTVKTCRAAQIHPGKSSVTHRIDRATRTGQRPRIFRPGRQSRWTGSIQRPGLERIRLRNQRIRPGSARQLAFRTRRIHAHFAKRLRSGSAIKLSTGPGWLWPLRERFATHDASLSWAAAEGL